MELTEDVAAHCDGLFSNCTFDSSMRLSFT
jgi:hypothetical protein